MKVFGLRKCTTCQKALALLAEKKKKVVFTDHKEAALTKQQVAAWSKAVGGWEKLINRAGYTWRGLPQSETENLIEAKAVALALRFPSLIRRPLIEQDDGTVTVGFTKSVQERF